MADRSFVAVLLAVLAGALIWAIHFTIIYGFAPVACARGFADAEVLGMDLVRPTIFVATGVAALAVLVGRRPFPPLSGPALTSRR